MIIVNSSIKLPKETVAGDWGEELLIVLSKGAKGFHGLNLVLSVSSTNGMCSAAGRTRGSCCHP